MRATSVALALAMGLAVLAGGCSNEQPDTDGAAAAKDKGAQGSQNANPRVAAADEKLVLAFGDSLYAGYQLPGDQGFAPELERALAAKGIKARVHNGGVSGDTTAAGLQRLAFTLDGLERKPDLVVLGLGGNDMLRGISPEQTRANMVAMMDLLKVRGIPAVLTGMLAAPNLGPDYVDAFNTIYPTLSKTYDAPLYPFFLDGVVGKGDLMLPDGIHPNEKGVDVVAGKIAPLVVGVLK